MSSDRFPLKLTGENSLKQMDANAKGFCSLLRPPPCSEAGATALASSRCLAAARAEAVEPSPKSVQLVVGQMENPMFPKKLKSKDPAK